MRLAPDHHMIQTLASDRSDHPFGKAKPLLRLEWRDQYGQNETE